MASYGTALLRCVFVIAVLVGAFQAAPLSAGLNKALRSSPTPRDATDGFLPRTIWPINYQVEITPDIYTSPEPPFSFSGSVVIIVNCTVQTNSVVLNMFGLSIVGVDIRTDPSNPIPPPSPIMLEWSVNPAANFLTINVTNALEVGYIYRVLAYFTGTLNNGDVGLNWNSYADTDGTIKYVVATNLQEIGARRVFPCLDEPDFKATFDITILSQSPMIVLSNTEEISQEDRGAYTAHHFATTPVMPAYQVAIIVGDLVGVPVTWSGSYPITLYSRPQVASQLQFAASIVGQIQTWFEEVLGVPYPLSKLDHVAIPSESWETEAWGAITYGETYLLINNQYSGAVGKLRVARTIAHEVAHQWLCNLVTFKTYDDVWLREGFGQHYGYRALDAIGWPGREMQQIDETEGTLDYLNYDSVNTSDPVRKRVPTIWDAEAASLGSTYQKGGAIFRQLQGVLTASTFRTAMTNFVAKHAYGSVTTLDLWDELSAQAAADGRPIDVGDVTDPWIEQWGYPLVFVSNNGNGTATAMPRQYFNPSGLTATDPSPYNYEWPIPVTIATQETTEFDTGATQWIPHGATSYLLEGIPTAPTDWFILNANQQFFYRIDYDLTNRANIINQLRANHTVIPTESRAQIIDDTFQLSETMNTLSSTAMDTSLYLAQETEYGPWHVGLKHLRTYDRFLQGYLWYTNYRSYMSSLVLPLYNTLGWSYVDTEHPFQQLLRRDILVNACYYGLADCQEFAQYQFGLFRADPTTTAVDPNNLPTVLCLGVASGTSAEWSFVFQQYLNRIQSSVREERFAYLFAMACSTDTIWLERYLSYITASTGIAIADRDKDPAMFYLTQSRSGLPIVRSYLYNTWASIPSTISKFDQLREATRSLMTISDNGDFNNFVSLNPPANNAERDQFHQMSTTILQNADWIETNEFEIQNWLDANAPPTEKVDLRSPLPISPMAYWNVLHKTK